jgi:hypothetical protein
VVPVISAVTGVAHEWQSLIAGLLGLAGGVIAYLGAIRAANRQVAALKDQIKDAQTARRLTDERRLSVIKWAVSAEGRRLDAVVSALRHRALPSAPQPAARRREQLIIRSSPLLRGEWEEIALLDDRTRGLLEELAELVDKYNSRIETAVEQGHGPLIEQETLDLIDHLAEAVKKMSVL